MINRKALDNDVPEIAEISRALVVLVKLPRIDANKSPLTDRAPVSKLLRHA